ncbi:MAG TPA: hypothetical protein PKW11_13190 [Pseudomonadota bacterium]|nr:hypothetical protein [Pseudomonadota bacterium]
MTSSKLPRTERAIRLFAETLFSDLNGPPPPDRLAQLAEDATALVAATTQRARLLFQLCLFGVLWAAPLFVWRRPGLSRLPLAGRVAALESMESHPLGAALVLAIKAVLCVLWYEQPENHAAIGGDPFCQPGHRRLPILQGAKT